MNSTPPTPVVTEPPPLPPFPPAEPKNPFEVFILVWIALASASFTTGDPGSRSLQQALPERAVILWGACAMIGAVMALVGILVQKWTNDGLVLERTGIILVGGAAAVYGYVIYNEAAQIADVRYIVAVQIALSMASLWRAWHITKRLRWARRVTEIGTG